MDTFHHLPLLLFEPREQIWKLASAQLFPGFIFSAKTLGLPTAEDLRPLRNARGYVVRHKRRRRGPFPFGYAGAGFVHPPTI